MEPNDGAPAPEEILDRSTAQLEGAEGGDDEARLRVLEEMHRSLEAELARPELEPQS